MTPVHLLPAPVGFPLRQRPAEALEALEALAREIPGPGRFYVVTDGVLGVLSLPAASVWTTAGSSGGTTTAGPLGQLPTHRARSGGWLSWFRQKINNGVRLHPGNELISEQRRG